MRRNSIIGRALLIVLALFASLAWAGGTPRPEVVIEQPGHCVADKDTMRRNHPDMLKHQRDRTLREGIRGEKVSLNACISCHASKESGSVLGSDKNFCQACHSYAAVKLDCFECHQARPGNKTGPLAARGGNP